MFREQKHLSFFPAHPITGTTSTKAQSSVFTIGSIIIAIIDDVFVDMAMVRRMRFIDCRSSDPTRE
jgi:hypothetical protein